MQASVIIDEASSLLLDPDHTYWPEPELLGYLDEAQGLIAELKPDAVTVTVDHSLTAGPRQSLPDDGFLLVDVVRNTGGAAITAVEARDMDRMVPDWPSATGDQVEHYMTDTRNPRGFSVYPAPADDSLSVELRYAQRPGELAQGSDDLTVRDEYRPALVDYVLYRAHSKDTTAAVPQRAQAHYQQFRAHLGLSNQAAQAQRAGERDAQGLK